MKLTKRMYQCENDYWQLREFLRDVFLFNDRREYSWQAARLDYWYWFGNPNLEHYSLNETVSIWETDEGDVAAFVTPESRGHAYLQVHPAFRAPELEDEILAAAEAHLSVPDDAGTRHLTVWAHQRDSLRQELLRARGYTRGGWAEYQFLRCLETAIADVPLPLGYTIRSLGDTTELPARSWLSWRVFHPDEPAEHYQGWVWYPDIQRCPLYRRDLDLVVVAPNGDLAAFCTIWYDDVTRTGYFEPVGTSPDYQRKGLGKAVMTEGLRRLKHMGALYATVAGYSQAAIALYSSVMSPEYQLFERWGKSFNDAKRG